MAVIFYPPRNTGGGGGGGGGGTWGSITGTLSSQTDLQTALNGKSDVGHTHTNINSLVGFATSENTSAPNNTVNASRLLVVASTTNADFVIEPKGTGAIIGELPDSAIAGGNKRGANAIDLQLSRALATQVASGGSSALVGGTSNIANGTSSGVFAGSLNTTTRLNTVILGGGSNSITGISDNASILAGLSNSNSGASASIIGGQYNIIDNSSYTAIISGQNNQITGGSGTCVIVGGQSNVLTNALGSVILGGRGFTAQNCNILGFNANIDGIRNISINAAVTNTAVFNNVDLWLSNNDNTPRTLRFYEQYNSAGVFPNGTNYVAFRAPNSIAADVTWTLPNADGTNGQVLQTNGTGTLSWATPSGGAATWGSITGTLSSQTDLQTALNAKADTSALSNYLLKSSNLSDVANVVTARSNLGLGSIALQNSNSVTITGGNITGLTSLTVTNPSASQISVGNGNDITLRTAGTGILQLVNQAGTVYSRIVSGSRFDWRSDSASTPYSYELDNATGLIYFNKYIRNRTAGNSTWFNDKVVNTTGVLTTTDSCLDAWHIVPTSGVAIENLIAHRVTTASTTVPTSAMDLRTMANGGGVALFRVGGGINGVYFGNDVTNSATRIGLIYNSNTGYNLTFPPTVGSNGQVLQTDGTGTLSWATPSGGISGFTSAAYASTPNSSVNVSQLLAASGTTNVDIALTPKGSGSILAQIPDNTATGGNKRGIWSVDLQMVRSSNSQVVSGAYSFTSGRNNTVSEQDSSALGHNNNVRSATSFCVGTSNTTSNAGNNNYLIGESNSSSTNRVFAWGASNTLSTGTYMAAFGLDNSVDHNYSFAFGNRTKTSNKNQFILGNSQGTNRGSSQVSIITMYGTATSASFINITDGSTTLNVPLNCAVTAEITIIGKRRTDAGTVVFRRLVSAVNNAGTTSLLGSVETIGTDINNALSGVIPSISVVDATDSIDIQVSGRASETIDFTATIVLTQVSSFA